MPFPPKASMKKGMRVRFAAARTRVSLLAENASTRALALVLQAANITPPPRKGTRMKESATSRWIFLDMERVNNHHRAPWAAGSPPAGRPAELLPSTATTYCTASAVLYRTGPGCRKPLSAAAPRTIAGCQAKAAPGSPAATDSFGRSQGSHCRPTCREAVVAQSRHALYCDLCPRSGP